MENENVTPLQEGGIPPDEIAGNAAEGGDGSISVKSETPDSVLMEHRRALARMRAAAAIDMLIDASDPRDADVVRRLLDFDCAELAATEDENGIPDTRAVREKLSQLRRDCGYLFHQGHNAGIPSAVSDRDAVHVTHTDDDPDRMSDDDYYRTYFKP